MFSAVLYDQTSGVNAALDTGVLDLSLLSVDALTIEELPSGAAVAGALTLIDADSGTLVSFATAANTNPGVAGWGFNVSPTAGGTYLGGLPCPLPQRVRVQLSALGAGITGRLRILAGRIGR